MQRTVIITLIVEDDHAEANSAISMAVKADPPWEENERSLLAGVVNELVRRFEGERVTLQ